MGIRYDIPDRKPIDKRVSAVIKYFKPFVNI